MPDFVDDRERQEVLAYFLERFGIPEEVFDGFQFFQSGKVIRIISDVVGLKEAMHLYRIGTPGIPLLRRKRPIWKPTTVALQIFGQKATRNIVNLRDEQVDVFLQGCTLDENFSLATGYVIVKWAAHVLGCAFYEKGLLESQIPREWRGVQYRRT